MRLKLALDRKRRRLAILPSLHEARLQRLNELLDRHSLRRARRVEQIAQLDDFVVGEFGVVLAKEVLELVGVDLSVGVLVGRDEVGFDGFDDGGAEGEGLIGLGGSVDESRVGGGGLEVEELDGAAVVHWQGGRGDISVVGGGESAQAGFEAVDEGGGAVDGDALGEDEFSLLAECCSEDHDWCFYCSRYFWLANAGR
mmetsp:Transcript_3681/g.8158  ORF Transcript_3681/g.8158 Transcript_3681/m.8158 type:complete len:198 (+) Transcript_3681:1042-1635(+)